MWLFDNLFLDQNTPVMINDGVDHSKDVITPFIPPTLPKPLEEWADIVSSDANANEENPDIKKWGFDALFERDKKDISTSDVPASPIEFTFSPVAVDASAPETDAIENPLSETSASEISISEVPVVDSGIVEGSISEISPPETSISEVPIFDNPIAQSPEEDGAVSFDIGGDMSFDIGGDMGGDSIPATPGNREWTFIKDGAPIDISPTSFPEDASTVSQTWETSASSQDTINEETLPETIPEPSSIVSGVQDTGNSRETDSALFSLLNDDVSVSTLVQESSSLDNHGSILDSSLETSPHVRDRLGSITSSKLKTKLEEFIDELSVLEAEDQSTREEKQKQIEMYRARVEEIKAEYDMRIHALEMEEQDLEKQISAMSMANEKIRIKDVIHAIRAELERT